MTFSSVIGTIAGIGIVGAVAYGIYKGIKGDDTKKTTVTAKKAAEKEVTKEEVKETAPKTSALKDNDDIIATLDRLHEERRAEEDRRIKQECDDLEAEIVARIAARKQSEEKAASTSSVPAWDVEAEANKAVAQGVDRAKAMMLSLNVWGLEMDKLKYQKFLETTGRTDISLDQFIAGEYEDDDDLSSVDCDNDPFMGDNDD